MLDACKKRGWKETDDETQWDLFWAEKDWIHEVMDQIHLSNTQKVNHFRNHYEVISLKVNSKRLDGQEFETLQEIA